LEVATISSQQTRSWQKIAALASQEKDPAQMLELVQELIEALEERDKVISRNPAAKAETA
jgi:hypothetical protein